jgi:hypothetical protein
MYAGNWYYQQRASLAPTDANRRVKPYLNHRAESHSFASPDSHGACLGISPACRKTYRVRSGPNISKRIVVATTTDNTWQPTSG